MIALFGSVLTERFQKSSDVDILVQFEAQHIPGLIRLSELELEAKKLIEIYRYDTYYIGNE